jgi:sigma-B regulation protein RsbQ
MSNDVLVRNHVTQSGDPQGRPMLFGHGFGCGQQMWRFVAPAFADHRVVLFDYVGSGRSDLSAYDPGRYGDLAGYAQDVLDIVERLDLRDVVFVGHSVSSMIGVLAANRRPERFSRLVLVGPSPRYVDDPPGYVGGFAREEIEGLLDLMDRNYLGWARALAPTVMGLPSDAPATQELEESFCSTDPKTARQFAEVTFLSDNRRDLAEVRVPSLILQCTDDAIAPSSVGEFCHRNLARSTLERLRARGHCPHLSAPDETIAVVRDWLLREV